MKGVEIREICNLNVRILARKGVAKVLEVLGESEGTQPWAAS